MNQSKPSYLPAALAGGLFLGFFSGIPILNCLNCACCLMVIGGGLVSAYIYLRNYPQSLPQVTYGEGALLGILTGLCGTVFWSFIHFFITFIKGLMGMRMAGMESLREAISSPGVPPEVRELLENIFENYVFSDSLTPILLIFTVIMIAVVSVLFATIGSIVGVALFQKKPLAENQDSTGI